MTKALYAVAVSALSSESRSSNWILATGHTRSPYSPYSSSYSYSSYLSSIHNALKAAMTTLSPSEPPPNYRPTTTATLSRLHRSEIEIQTLRHSFRATGPRSRWSGALKCPNPCVVHRPTAISGHQSSPLLALTPTTQADLSHFA